MQLDRVRLQSALAVSSGLATGRGGELSRPWFDAMAFFDSQINELEFKVNAERDKASLRAMLATGW